MDQYYYSRMKDTTRRDNDQVVSRQTGLQEEGIFAIKEVPSPPSDGPKMIMVDQLWLSLWVVEQRKLLPGGRERWSLLSSAVLTSFPHTSYPRSRSGFPSLYRTADVRQKVLERLEQYEDEGTYRACSLVSSILSASILGTLSVRQDWSLDFLELFREAIGEAAEKQDNFFRNFDRSMRSGRKPLGVEQRREEIKLGLELADIVDELNMLRQLLDTQMDVLRKAIDKLYEILLDGTYCVDVIHTEMKRIRAELMDVHSLQINRMLDDSERVQKRLMDLLDLQQKEQNIYEAQRANQQALFTAKHALSAEDQADATNAQSQILFIFTLVTIVFLPLSFITSYFGLFNVNNPEGGNVNYGRSYVDTVMGAASGVMTTAFLVGAVAWYYWSKKQSADQRAKELQKYEDNGDLPPGLIFDDSQDRQRMDKFNPRHVDRAKTSKPVVDEKENEAVWPVESSLDRLISRIGKRGLKPEDEGNQQEQV
jgi:Mg2+ and Co2+ transporter CorA